MLQLGDIFRVVHRSFAVDFTIKIMRGCVHLHSFAATICVGGSNATVLVIFAIVTVRNVCFIASLLRALRLVRKGKISRADLPFAIEGMDVIASSIFNVLGGSVCFYSFLRRIAYRARDGVVNVFVLIGLILPRPTGDSKVESTVPTSRVGANADRTAKNCFYIYRRFSRREFVSFYPPYEFKFVLLLGIFSNEDELDHDDECEAFYEEGRVNGSRFGYFVFSWFDFIRLGGVVVMLLKDAVITR